MKSSDRVVIAWCDPGEVDGSFAYDLIALNRARPDRLHPAVIRAIGGGLLSRTRNQVVKAFLDTDAAWLWMVDSDHKLPVASFDRIVEAAHEQSHPVVAGLYFAAYDIGAPYPRPVPCAYRVDGQGRYMPVDTIEPPGLHRIDGAGTGTLLVHRRVFEAMRDAVDDGMKDWCWFQDGPLGDGRWLSEDLTFCARVAEAGFPIHVHTGAVFPHHKQFWQDADTWRLWRKQDG